jgi:hypothetical protein
MKNDKVERVIDSQMKQAAQTILGVYPKAKIVYINIDDNYPVKDREGRITTVDSVFAIDEHEEDLGIMQVATLHQCTDVGSCDCLEKQEENNLQALRTVIVDAKKLGFTHYVLDDGYNISSGKTSAFHQANGRKAK